MPQAPATRRRWFTMNLPNPDEPARTIATKADGATRRNWIDYSPLFNGAMVTGVAIQAVLGVLSLLVLDMGQAWRTFWVSMLCQWAVVLIILLRRPMAPTKLDLDIVRYGIVPLVVIVNVFGPILLRAMGITNS